MPRPPDGASRPPLNLPALIGALERHHVEYILVGGIAAQAHGATRPTGDIDTLVRQESANLERLATAMRELGARLRAEGLTDDEAKALPVILDGRMLGGNEVTTWRTDAGDLDVLTNIPARDGRRLRYEDLAGRANIIEGAHFAIRAASLTDIIASKEWADRPKDRDALPELRALRDAQHAGEVTAPLPRRRRQ